MAADAVGRPNSTIFYFVNFSIRQSKRRWIFSPFEFLSFQVEICTSIFALKNSNFKRQNVQSVPSSFWRAIEPNYDDDSVSTSSGGTWASSRSWTLAHRTAARTQASRCSRSGKSSTDPKPCPRWCPARKSFLELRSLWPRSRLDGLPSCSRPDWSSDRTEIGSARPGWILSWLDIRTLDNRSRRSAPLGIRGSVGDRIAEMIWFVE